MRLTKSIAFAVSALALSTGAAFAGGDAMSPEDQRHYQSMERFVPYEQGGPHALSPAPELLNDPALSSALSNDEYAAQVETYDVYVVPAEIVLVPIEQPSEVPIDGDELS